MDKQARAIKIENYSQDYNQLEQLLADLPPGARQFQAAPDMWSVTQIIVHLTDIEANNYMRYRNVVVKPGQTVSGVDADEWAGAFDYQQQNVDEALELFRLLRTSNGRLLKFLPETIWNNLMQHTERGEINLEQLVELQLNHINVHLNQLRETIEVWKEQQIG